MNDDSSYYIREITRKLMLLNSNKSNLSELERVVVQSIIDVDLPELDRTRHTEEQEQ